ncbi:isocitrate/isopropylmalate dehydrogenase family protein [Gordonia amarae]|nr:putative 3-isopropylmalate dehydrogenase [Gordonia amarae NBRC 15530]
MPVNEPSTGATALAIGVMHGDGIGPEIVPAAVAVADAAAARAGFGIEWRELPFGASAIGTHGTPIPGETLDALSGLDLWVLGPHDSAAYPVEFAGDLTPGGVIRKRFDLYANLRPSRALPGVAATAPGIDILIARENSEGLYADRNMAVGSGEFMPTPDIALSVGVITRAATQRIAHEAFRAAQSRSKHVTIVHKANVLRLTTGLFRDVCREVAADYPDVRVDDFHVDAMAAMLVRLPEQFDVVVTENLFGDILSDLAGELAGSLGVAASVNCSSRQAMAQAAHGAAPDIAGRGIANPVAVIGSTAMLLRWYARRAGRADVRGTADRIDAAVAATLAAGVCTPDLGGSATTAVFTDRVLANIADS